MKDVTFYCMTATPFKKTGELDEAAFRDFLQPIVASKLGIWLCSGGSGEGHALNHREMKRVYEIGVEEARRGNVPCHANPPEQHTIQSTRELAQIAIDAGVDVVHMYTLAGWHGMKPTDDEIRRYYDEVLATIRHPITVAVNYTMGYIPKAELMAEICRKHRQVVAAKFTGVEDIYFFNVRDLMDRDISYYVQPQGSLNAMLAGADGIFGSESNIIPQTYRRYLDLFLEQDYAQIGKVYSDLRRFNQFVNKWGPSNPRWLKMAMKVLKLPGGEGGIRDPYLMPSENELRSFASGLVKLNIPELNDVLARAGVKGAA